MPSSIYNFEVLVFLQGFFMQKDYKMFPPSVNWDNINWSTRRPQMDFPVQVIPCVTFLFISLVFFFFFLIFFLSNINELRNFYILDAFSIHLLIILKNSYSNLILFYVLSFYHNH